MKKENNQLCGICSRPINGAQYFNRKEKYAMCEECYLEDTYSETFTKLKDK